MKVFVKCTGTERLIGKDRVAVFQSKDVTLTIIVKKEDFEKFKKGHEYELILTE